jgi:hypothetical protein
MRAARRRKRTQRLLLLMAAGLGAYVWLVYQPLARQAADLDEPLTNLWKELAETSLSAPVPIGHQLPQIDAVLDQVSDSLDALDNTRASLLARIDPGPNLTDRIQASFQLIDFQNERQLITEQLLRAAQQKKVTLGPALTAGFPEYMADRPQPALLWAQLSLLWHTLTSAIDCGVTAVPTVQSPEVRFFRGSGSTRDFLAEVPLEIEVVASAPAAARFLESLPLRSGELEAQGLPEVGPEKPAYFIHRIFLRKESRERLDEVRLKVTVSSLIYLTND